MTDPVRTRALEEILYRANHDENPRRILLATYRHIKDRDVSFMEKMQYFFNSKTSESREYFGYLMEPCLAAGIGIRDLIITKFEAVGANASRATQFSQAKAIYTSKKQTLNFSFLSDPTGGMPIDIIAENMTRCEMIKFGLNQSLPRLVGTALSK